MNKNHFKGKAVVLFCNSEAAEAAIHDRCKKQVNKCHALNDFRLEVTNLPKDFTDDDLYRLFDEFGKIRSA